MTKRALAIFLLIVAFLLSAWGNVIAASFCPRYLAQNCFAHSTPQGKQVEPESCDHEMADMDTGDMNMQMDEDSGQLSDVTSIVEIRPRAALRESTVEQIALAVPNEPCGHCWMHSQPSSGTGIIATVNPSPRSVEALAPPAETTIDLGFPNPTAIEPIEHGPPGNSSPRHLLINVFRI